MPTGSPKFNRNQNDDKDNNKKRTPRQSLFIVMASCFLIGYFIGRLVNFI